MSKTKKQGAGPRVEYVALGDLKVAPRNPKRHDAERIRRSIARFGFVAPLIEDARTGKLVAGHGRVDALRLMKEAGDERPARVLSAGTTKSGRAGKEDWLVPVLRGVEFATAKEAEAYLLADNRLAEVGGWDDDALLEILRSAEGRDDLGWSDDDLTALLPDEKPAVGPSPEDLEAKYHNAEIKQIVLYFQSEEFDQVVERLGAVMASTGTTSHTDAFLALLKAYEKTRRKA